MPDGETTRKRGTELTGGVGGTLGNSSRVSLPFAGTQPPQSPEAPGGREALESKAKAGPELGLSARPPAQEGGARG